METIVPPPPPLGRTGASMAIVSWQTRLAQSLSDIFDHNSKKTVFLPSWAFLIPLQQLNSQSLMLIEGNTSI